MLFVCRGTLGVPWWASPLMAPGAFLESSPQVTYSLVKGPGFIWVILPPAQWQSYTGLGCGREGLPGLYTTVARHVEWARQTMLAEEEWNIWVKATGYSWQWHKNKSRESPTYLSQIWKINYKCVLLTFAFRWRIQLKCSLFSLFSYLLMTILMHRCPFKDILTFLLWHQLGIY